MKRLAFVGWSKLLVGTPLLAVNAWRHDPRWVVTWAIVIAIGVVQLMFAARDRRTDREPRYVGPALRRSVR